MGVNMKKYIIAMTIGAIILPNNSPNFTQILLKGVSILEFIRPKIKKIIEIPIDKKNKLYNSWLPN